MKDTKLFANLENRPLGSAFSREFGMSVKEGVLKCKLKRALDILEGSKENSLLHHKPSRGKVQPIANKFVGWRRR